MWNWTSEMLVDLFSGFAGGDTNSWTEAALGGEGGPSLNHTDFQRQRKRKPSAIERWDRNGESESKRGWRRLGEQLRWSLVCFLFLAPFFVMPTAGLWFHDTSQCPHDIWAFLLIGVSFYCWQSNSKIYWAIQLWNQIMTAQQILCLSLPMVDLLECFSNATFVISKDILFIFSKFLYFCLKTSVENTHIL